MIDINKKTILCYTDTDCYRPNANYKGIQRQLCLRQDDELFNVYVNGFVNRPADDGRERRIIDIKEIEQNDLMALLDIAKNYQPIEWNTGKYTVYPNYSRQRISNKKAKEIKQAESNYIQVLIKNCEPYNKKAKRITLFQICKVLRKYVKLHKEEFHNFIYIW